MDSKLIDNKLLLFGGKGGVGKTSMAAATAIHAASSGKKVLVMSTDPAHSLSDSYDLKIGNKITPVKKNLDALEIDAPSLLVEYKKKYGTLIKQIANEGTFFSKDDIQEFFDLSLPGMDELMAMLKIIDILEKKEYDLLILDTAPTGHTIRLLELPNLMDAYIKVLAEMRRKHYVVVTMMTRRKYIKDEADNFIDKMHSDVQRLKLVLKDSTTQFVPVLIPEPMAIAETQRLVNTLKKYQIPVNHLILNRVIKENCAFCKLRSENQLQYFQEIKNKFSTLQISEVPLLATEVKGENLVIISKILYQAGYSQDNEKNKNNENNENKKTTLTVKVKDLSQDISFDSLSIKPTTKFLLFGGKGGVGKTSCAAAVALKESKTKKVLIFSTDPAHSLSDSLSVNLGNTVQKINENLSALEIDSYSLFENLKKDYQKEINEFFSSVFKSTTAATIDAPYDRKVMEELFNLAPPGIDEIMALKTIMDLMQEKKYDLFILDTAPTGHTIRLLEMPEVAESWVSTLLNIQGQYPISFEVGETLEEMLKTIKQVRSMLADSSKSEFVLVSIPEAMSVLETFDLVANLNKLKVSVNYIIINKLLPASSCSFCSVKRSEQFTYVNELQTLNLKMVGVEMFDKEVHGKASLDNFAKSLFNKKKN